MLATTMLLLFCSCCYYYEGARKTGKPVTEQSSDCPDGVLVKAAVLDLEALAVDNRRTGFVVLLLADPHALES